MGEAVLPVRGSEQKQKEEFDPYRIKDRLLSACATAWGLAYTDEQRVGARGVVAELHRGVRGREREVIEVLERDRTEVVRRKLGGVIRIDDAFGYINEAQERVDEATLDALRNPRDNRSMLEARTDELKNRLGVVRDELNREVAKALIDPDEETRFFDRVIGVVSGWALEGEAEAGK